MTRYVAAGLLALIVSADACSGQATQRTYANPIDIDYRYNFEQHNEGISYRSGADPVIVVHRGEYYLFETIGEGYWRSRDLGTWRAHHAFALAADGHRRARSALGSRHHLPVAEYDSPAADPDADGAGDGPRRVLQSPASLAADGARPRARPVRKTGLGATGSVGSAVLPRSGHRALVPLLELVQRVSAARHRARQDQTARVQGNAALAVRTRAGEARLGAFRPGPSRHAPSSRSWKARG